MSTPSMLLLCAGAAASLAGVWTLAGLSESSTLRSSPRVVVATAIGLLGEAVLYGRAPNDVRTALLLPLLFGTASVLALAVGAAKIESALAERDGPRVVRRSAGIVAGSYFGVASIGATSLDLSTSSLVHARLSWALMFALVAGVLVVFSQRARYAGVGALALGQRVWVLALVGVGLLVGARLTLAAPSHTAPLPEPAAAASPAALPSVTAPAVVEAVSAAAPSAAAPSAAIAPEAPAPSAPVALASASAAPSASPGEVQIESLAARGMLEADARGGVLRRKDRLQACLADPQNQQSGALSLKIRVDASGSVSYSRAMGGDLLGSALAACLMPVFYKMGFAAPPSGSASFEITLRAQAR